jgi:valyl-tRNA synthetase
VPWRTAAISGWILDPDRKKMSKSKGNVVTPADLLAEYGSDAVRYWAASARPGTDTAYDTGQMKVGRRLAVKLLNASKFVLGIGVSATDAAVTEPIDLAMLAELADTVRAATEHFEAYDYARALERAEEFFWNFCDNYLELVKQRAYGEEPVPGIASARLALRIALSAIIRLFAPFLPFAAEEVWSWWHDDSVHRAPWPAVTELGDIAGADREILATAAEVIAAVRKAKSEAKVSMRTEVAAVQIAAAAETVERALRAEDDLRAAGHITKIEHTVTTGPGLRVSVTL